MSDPVYVYGHSKNSTRPLFKAVTKAGLFKCVRIQYVQNSEPNLILEKELDSIEKVFEWFRSKNCHSMTMAFPMPPGGIKPEYWSIIPKGKTNEKQKTT